MPCAGGERSERGDYPVGEAEGDRAAGAVPDHAGGSGLGRRVHVVVRAVRTPRRRARGRGVWPCDVRAIHSIVRVRDTWTHPVRADRVYYMVYYSL